MSARGTHERSVLSQLFAWQKPSIGQCSETFIQHYPSSTDFSTYFILLMSIIVSDYSHAIPFIPITFTFYNLSKISCPFIAFNLLTLFCRTQDIKTKKHHIPLVDRTPLEPPPIVIVVMGPPKVGKSTLIRCLIKSFTRQKLSDICGPVTIVSGQFFNTHIYI